MHIGPYTRSKLCNWRLVFNGRYFDHESIDYFELWNRLGNRRRNKCSDCHVQNGQ